MQSFLNNFAGYSGDTFYKKNASLWITDSAPHVFLSDNTGIDVLGSVSLF